MLTPESDLPVKGDQRITVQTRNGSPAAIELLVRKTVEGELSDVVVELQRREAYLAEAQRLSRTGSFGWSVSTGEIFWSDETFHIFEFSPFSTLSLRTILERVHPQDMASLEMAMAAANRAEGTDLECRLLMPDGRIKYLHVVGKTERAETGGIEVIGAVMDITERKVAEQAIRRSEAYLAEAQRLSHTGSFGCRLSTGEMFWSEETFRIYGYDRSTQPAVERVLERVHPEDRVLLRERIDQAKHDEKDCCVECRLLLPDGSVKHISIVAHPSKNESGTTEFIGAIMDVTAHWQAKDELEKAFEEIKRLKDRLNDENVALREEINKASMFEEIVGTSPALHAVLSRISKVAPTDSTVLLTGETGTGKELVARAIHQRSNRASRVFVSMNCAAIPRDLIASELFGHEKGAFTGAIHQRLGRFELADGGTLFLDEVGELPAETQIALLRVLQEHEFERVGGARPIRTDVRVIAATNRDLQAAMGAGSFRRDLFYRLNVFPIEIPPLRERKEDIRLLVDHFIDRYTRKAGKNITTVDKKTLRLLESYPWPGNIRELQNVVERSLIVCETASFSVDESWLSHQPPERKAESQHYLSEKMSTQEKGIIEAALRECQGRVFGPSGAAAKLGMARSTLESKIQSLKIDKNCFRALQRA